ncbi:MAG: helix-turn-helix domain-containing protein, partial [Caulobacteraceae bacterium]
MEDDIARAADAKRGSPYLSTVQVARFLGLAPQSIEKMRRRGDGPPFRKHGRYVRYHVDDVTAWSGGRMRTSTSPQA